MTAIILRRPKLGRATKDMVANFSNRIDAVVRNDKRIPPNLSVVFRWGCTSNIDAATIVNTAEAIHRVNNKAGFRSLLMDTFLATNDPAGKPLCPPTYLDAQMDTLSSQVEQGVAMVVRPRTHAQGKHVYLVRTLAQLEDAIRRCGPGWYASEYINKVAEYRVTFVQGRVVWVAQKTPSNPQDVAWNVARGGRFDNVRFGDWPLRPIRVAREAFLLTGLDFGAVDIMVGPDGTAYVLEVNSAPSQTSPYRQECMARAFDYIVENGKASIPVVEERGGWRKFVHPAVSNEALVGN